MTTTSSLPTGEWASGYDDVLAGRAGKALARKVSLGVDIGPNVLMLNWGMPNPGFLPAEATMEAIAATLREDLPTAMEYDFPQGDPKLREIMAERLAVQNKLPVHPDQVTFNGGSSLSLENFCRAVLEPGDIVVITEDPSYPGTLHHYRLSDAEVHGVPVDTDGIRTDLLAETMERLTAEGKRIKVIHTIPDFQNPTGNTISLQRRRELLAVAAHFRAIVVEDVAYRELYFDEPPPPSLYTLAKGEGVVQVGTFAKTWATGIRIGWVLASPSLAPGIAATHTEAGITSILTGAMRRIVTSGQLDERILDQRVKLQEGRDAAISALARYAGETIRFETPTGGYFLWLRLPDGTDARQVVIDSARESVMLLPGSPFHVDGQPRPYLRIAYSYLDPDLIDEALRRVCSALDGVLSAST